MESGTQTPNNGANTGLLVTPSPAQVKDRDRERDRARRVHREREARERDLSMSVQPIAPQSRQPSQHVPGGTPVGAVSPVTGNPGTSAAHHPYANPGVDVRGSNANVNGGMGMGAPSGIQMSGPYPRTTSNSPLPSLLSVVAALLETASCNGGGMLLVLTRLTFREFICLRCPYMHLG